MMTIVHRLQWLAAWTRMADRAREHLATLDPRTDRLAILRWQDRWRRALDHAADSMHSLVVACMAQTERIEDHLRIAEDPVAWFDDLKRRQTIH